MTSIELPYPPSVNHYWRLWRGRMVISTKGRAYRNIVAKMARMNGVRFGAIPVAVTIAAYMPDKRRRDVDNICKAVLDALGAGGLYDDDSQVHDLHVFRAGYHKPSGKIIVSCEAADKCPL